MPKQHMLVSGLDISIHLWCRVGCLCPGVEATTQVAAKVSKGHFFENRGLWNTGAHADQRCKCVRGDLHSGLEKGSQVHTWEPGRAS